MKKKLLSILLCAGLTTSMLAGCGSGSNDSTNASTTDADVTTEDVAEDAAVEETAEEDLVISTVGPDSGTKMEMWSFVDVHNEFYAKMLDKWNEENPDKQIQITFTTYPYADMHNKLTLSLQSGEGAPDLVDIEIGQFPNFLLGDVQLHPMNDAIAQYEDNMVQARLDIYSKDGNYYGVPSHVGATVMYYNIKILEEYGIDYTTIKTWDDFTAAGEQLKEASGGEVSMTAVDTGGTDWLWVAMAQHGDDWTGGEGGKANMELDSLKKMLTMQKGWLDNETAIVCPDGQIDTEGGFVTLIDGKVAAFPKALWYMSRFLREMPEMTDTWAIAPCPVFEEGQPRSVGIGGTGTAVTIQSENAELAAEFISYAKCSEEGSKGIWEDLGFDTCNTKLWEDETITRDESNKYISYFVTNPFDVLNEIKEEIGKISMLTISPTINEQICNITLNSIFEDGQDIDEALAEAQSVVELEQ